MCGSPPARLRLAARTRLSALVSSPLLVPAQCNDDLGVGDGCLDAFTAGEIALHEIQ
jgi:hypothetical protein